MTNPITPPVIPVVPQYPQLGSSTFNQEAYAYATAMPAVTASISATAQNVYDNALQASESSSTARAAAIAAETSAQTAAGISSAPQWVAGDYAFGTFVWSPLSLLTYRRKTAGVTASTVDPSIDTVGWKLAGSVMSMPQIELTTAGPHNLAVGIHYIVKHPDAVCLMPAGAAPQEQVRVTNKSGDTRVLLMRNGSTFNNEVEDITLDSRGIDKTFTKAAGNTWL